MHVREYIGVYIYVYIHTHTHTQTPAHTAQRKIDQK